MALASLSTIDTAGGVIFSSIQSHVRANGIRLIVVGDHVADHGDGAHSDATMAIGSPVVRINGVRVIRAGDPATCGHIATGSSHVDVV